MPAMATRPDGMVLLTWFEMKLSDPLNPTVMARMIYPGGSPEPVTTAGMATFMTVGSELSAPISPLVPLLPNNGEARLGLLKGIGLNP
jgi:hypothetical protein